MSKNKTGNTREVSPYSVLAVGYDVVMEHVDYDFWAAYIHKHLKTLHPEAQTMLELGCGTGSFALSLLSIDSYQYLGTDGIEAMVQVARAKAEMEGANAQFEVADFTNFRIDQPVDVVLLLYDGLNYLLESEAVHELFRCVYQALQEGGLFIFDQSTPANSLNNEVYFEDRGETEAFSYVRHSRYDPDRRLHTTTFDLEVQGVAFHETHVQRAYSISEVRALIEETDFRELACYDSFTTVPATDTSERVHWILRK